MDFTKIKKYIRKIETTSRLEEQQILAVQGLFELFEADKAGIYSYSSLNKIIEGIIRISKEGMTSIRDHKEDARNLPPIHSSIVKREAIYIDKKLAHQIPRKYLDELKPFFVVPIYTPSNVVGYVAMARLKDDFKQENLLNSLNLYGKLLGEIFRNDDNPNQSSNKSKNLSPREKEILQRLSLGESIKEIADYLGLSPFTVQDYLKSTIKKLGVQNRVEGVALALREGIIR